MSDELPATSLDPAMARWLRALVPKSRHRARRSSLIHDIEGDCAEHLFRRQQGYCEVSGQKFKLDRFPDVLVKHPFAPSLDRILSREGYTAGNVRLVCIAVNFGLGQWGEELYLIFARSAMERSNQGSRLIAKTTDASLGDAEPNAPDESHAIAKWFSAQRERIAAAEAIASMLSGELLAQQRRRIASLKRSLTLGPAGLKAAAAKAAQTRKL